jgi:stage II sporulation protein E
LENGFSEERALEMVNLYMMLKNDREAPTTLDMGVMDLYSGICDFLKLGSACTFIKRGDWVECIRSCSLPIGMFGNIETEIITKKLYDKDMVILVSDGVVDAMKNQDKEEKLVNLIMDTDAKNPKEAATLLMEKISKQPDFKATDDMTILVAGVWDKG